MLDSQSNTAIQIPNGVLRLLDTHQFPLEVQEVLIQKDHDHNAFKDCHAKVAHVILVFIDHNSTATKAVRA